MYVCVWRCGLVARSPVHCFPFWGRERRDANANCRGLAGRKRGEGGGEGAVPIFVSEHMQV